MSSSDQELTNLAYYLMTKYGLKAMGSAGGAGAPEDRRCVSVLAIGYPTLVLEAVVEANAPGRSHALRGLPATLAPLPGRSTM